jgi:hypothetical protein
MSSPFDYAKSLLTSKENLYTTDDIFLKEYEPFMVNRILSNSPQATIFANVVNMFPELDKKLQHDFYFYGLPKTRGSGKMWTKKEIDEDELALAKYISSEMNVSLARGFEYLAFIDMEDVEANKKLSGGKVK